LSLPAVAAVLSPERFTSEFAVAVRKALPDHEITIEEPLQLKFKAPDGTVATAFLDNAYNQYIGDPASKAAIIDLYVAGLAETASESTEIDRQRIVPVIKDRAWLQDMQRSSGAADLDQMPEQVFEDFNDDLIIVYAEDTPKNIRYVSQEGLEKAGINREALRSLAVANLRRILPPVEMRSGPLISMLTAGGDYDASLLLLDDLWSAEKLSVDGEIVVAVPARDVLIFTGSRNAEGLKRLLELARKVVAEAPYSLSDRLFVFRDGKLQRFVQ
jgi:uncharacterized protein YtpQ (UPF0354 family)